MGNVFGRRSSSPQGVQDWQATLAVGEGIFDYYDSLGDVVISAGYYIPSVLDGPIVVRKYNNLTIDAATDNVTLSTSNRCRGLMLLVEGNLLLQRTGGYVPSISMTARGARGHAGMALYDVLVPDSIMLSGKKVSQRDVLKFIRDNGYAIIDRWMFDDWGKINGVSATAWTGGTVLLQASGCAGGAWGSAHSAAVNVSGNTGGAGTLAPGGGAGGALVNGPGASGFGGAGRPWGGGTGGGGSSNTWSATYPTYAADQYGGKGGVQANGVGNGAGNPAGDNSASGTGGCLYIICKGNVLINAGGLIEADGVQAPADGNAPGGSSGGGFVAIAYGGTYTNSGTVRANGGAARSGIAAGAAGGAGSVVTKTFGQMGW